MRFSAISSRFGREIGMEPLVEVHIGEELDRALAAGECILA